MIHTYRNHRYFFLTDLYLAPQQADTAGYIVFWEYAPDRWLSEFVPYDDQDRWSHHNYIATQIDNLTSNPYMISYQPTERTQQ